MEILFVESNFKYILAYLDPGTGSLILQLLLGGVAGAWVILKLFGQRIKALFGFKGKEEHEEEK